MEGEGVYEAVSVRIYILVFPVLTSLPFSRVAWVRLLTRSSMTIRQTLNSSFCVALKERHGVFLFFFQKHMPMAL